MIIKKAMYCCKKCKEFYMFEVDKPFSTSCPICGKEMEFEHEYNCDTELAEKVKNTPPYDPTKDPNSPYYIPIIECPYCHSTNTKKITVTSKAVHTAVLGIFSMGRNSKNYHCNQCNSDF